jgi:hypothetical protein
MTAYNPPLLERMLVGSRLAHVVRFTPTIQCYELVLKCARHYDLGTPWIIGSQGRVLASFTPHSVAQNFDIPDRPHVVGLDLSIAKGYYDDDPSKYLKAINSWLENPRPYVSKLPK